MLGLVNPVLSPRKLSVLAISLALADLPAMTRPYNLPLNHSEEPARAPM